MPKNQIVIDLENQIVCVYANQPDDLDVILVDWDGQGVDPRSANMVEVPGPRPFCTAFVLDIPVLPFSDLAVSDTEQAIDIAEEQGAFAERAGVTC